MKKFSIAVTTLICIGLFALAAQAAAVHYTFNEPAPGTWEVYVEVTGADTAGLSAYSLWVNAGAGVSYAENVLGTVDGTFTPIGFSPATLSSGFILGQFNVGNFQTFTAPILGRFASVLTVIPTCRLQNHLPWALKPCIRRIS